jgi:DNA-binding PadR family transcriptional regulator
MNFFKYFKFMSRIMKLMTKQEELVLLAVFRIKENAYLVNIRQHLIEHAGKDWAFGSLYMCLEKLRRNGMLRTRSGLPRAKKGGKAIKYYELTESALQELTALKRVNETMWREFCEYRPD